MVIKYVQFGFFTPNNFKILYYLSVAEETCSNGIWIENLNNFSLQQVFSLKKNAVQQLQSLLTLHCHKLVKSIKIRIFCDESVYFEAVCCSVNFLSQVFFVCLLFLGMVMYANEVETKEK